MAQRLISQVFSLTAVKKTVGVSGANVWFAVGDSATSAPVSSSFVNDTATSLITAANASKYLWQATETTFTDGTSAGMAGKCCLGQVSSFASVTEQYATGTATAATSDWKNDTTSGLTQGQGVYLWTRTLLTYNGGGTTTTTPRCIGYWGIDGKGIQSSVVTYSLQETTLSPESITDWGDFPATLTDGWWLYTKTHVVYSDKSETDSYSVAQVGTGSYYAGCEEYYAAGTSDSTAPDGAPDAKTYVSGETIQISEPWQQGTHPQLSTGKPYLWNFEISRDSRGNSYVTEPVCIGNFAKGITSIAETYAISALSVPESGRDYPSDIAESAWVDVAQDAAPTMAKPYQWNKTVTTYNDNTDETHYHVSAVRGDDALRIETDPVSVIWNQEGDVTLDSNNTPVQKSSWPEKNITAKVMSGSSDISSGYTFSWSITSPASSAGSFSVSQSGNVFTLSSPVKTAITTGWWTNGVLHIEAAKGTAKLEIDVEIALNPLGDWKMSVINDTMTATSSKTQSYTDGKVTELQSQITENAENIASKVEQTTYDSDKNAVSSRMSTIEQTSNSISARVQEIYTPANNLLDMGNIGQMELRGAPLYVLPKTAALTAGKTYTVTWQGKVRTTANYEEVCVYYGSSEYNHSYASGAICNSTSSAIYRYKFTAHYTGEYNIGFYICNSSGTAYSSTELATSAGQAYGSILDWIRIDEGDYLGTSNDASSMSPITEWEPSSHDIEALNLLPDSLLEDSTTAMSDDKGVRQYVNDQTYGGAMSITAKTTSADGYVHFYRASGYTASGSSSGSKGDICDGLCWYIPFRGAADYTLSASFKAGRSVTPTSGNSIAMEMHPCDSNKTRICYGTTTSYGQNDNDYGYVHRETTVSFGETATNSSGTAVQIEWLEVRLFMTRNGDMYASHLCLSRCSHATMFNAEELSADRKSEATQLATGIDIYNKKIVATGDNFEWRDNDGNRMAYFDKDEGAVFGGTIKAKNFYHAVCVNQFQGYVYYVPTDSERTETEQEDIDGYTDTDHPTYPYTGGAYLSEDALDEYWGYVGLRECTGNADIVIVPASGSTGTQDRYVTLPRSKDFEGKIIELFDPVPEADRTNIYVTDVGGGAFSAGVRAYTTSGSMRVEMQSSPPTQLTLKGSTRFFSMQDSDGTYYWLRMD